MVLCVHALVTLIVRKKLGKCKLRITDYYELRIENWKARDVCIFLRRLARCLLSVTFWSLTDILGIIRLTTIDQYRRVGTHHTTRTMRSVNLTSMLRCRIGGGGSSGLTSSRGVVRGMGSSVTRWTATGTATGTGTGTEKASSALDELSSSIERLARTRAEASAATLSNASASGSVHNPRSPTKERQTVSGRAFMNGHYYNPSTLTYESITQRPNRTARALLGPTKAEALKHDLIHINRLNPAKPSLHDDSYKNAAILANYVTEMGKIMPRASTGLTRKSQRLVGKAIRRARSMGLLPVMSRGGTRISGAGWK